MKTIKITEQPDKKTSELLAMCRVKFSVWSYYDDARLDKDFPAPKEATTRHFLAEQEPDKETLGLSTRQAEEKGFKNGITLRERILLELAYFEETGEHLDTKGVTFCTGSRDSDGDVPDVYWFSDGQKVLVSWYDLDDSDSEYGLRSAVSLDSFSSNSSDKKTHQEQVDYSIQYLKDSGYEVFKKM